MLQRCENGTKEFEKLQQESSQKLVEIEKQNVETSKQFHDFLNKSIQLVNDEIACAGDKAKAETNLINHKSALAHCKKTKEELMACVKKYRMFETSNNENINKLKEKYEIKWQEFEKFWYKGKFQKFLCI